MNLRDLIDKILRRQTASATTARERLQLVLAHDRSDLSPELLDQMPRDVEFTYNKKIDKLKFLLASSLTNNNRIKEIFSTIMKFLICKRNSEASSTMVPYTTLHLSPILPLVS